MAWICSFYIADEMLMMMNGSAKRRRDKVEEETQELHEVAQDGNKRAGASLFPKRRHHGRHGRRLARRL
jgi:hypothetical protein